MQITKVKLFNLESIFMFWKFSQKMENAPQKKEKYASFNNMNTVNYYNYDQSNPTIESEILSWMERCTLNLGIAIEQINYVFCTDDELLAINIEYLNHDYYTDIITFDLRDSINEPILADLYISLDRVKENAQTNNVSNTLELKRVMIHGILHICGYSDKTPENVIIMREKENYYINL